MSSQRQDRNKGRKTAVQLLYAAELTGCNPLDIANAGSAPEEVVLDSYAMELLSGVTEQRSRIDAYLASAAENWSVSRMPVVDKCILRLAVYEMLCVDKVPVSVTINEAVDLAKDFGGEDESHRFVNGVLGSIAARLKAEGEAAAAAAAPEAPEAPSAPEDTPAAVAQDAPGEAPAAPAETAPEPEE